MIYEQKISDWLYQAREGERGRGTYERVKQVFRRLREREGEREGERV
jgi:hypothetical protein